MSLKDKLIGSRRSVAVEVNGISLKVWEPTYTQSMRSQSAEEKVARIFIENVFDADGNPVFAANDLDGVKALPQSVVSAIDAALSEMQAASKKN